MKTTAFIAELLVIGTISLCWILPIINLSINIKITELLKLNTTGFILGIALIYLLGLLMNFISDRFFYPLDKYISTKYGGKEKLQHIRCELLLESSDAVLYMLQRRSIVRLFRANTLNFLFLTILSFFNLLSEYNFFITLTLIVITLVLFLGYFQTLKGYNNFLITMKAVINEN